MKAAFADYGYITLMVMGMIKKILISQQLLLVNYSVKYLTIN